MLPSSALTFAPAITVALGTPQVPENAVALVTISTYGVSVSAGSRSETLKASTMLLVMPSLSHAPEAIAVVPSCSNCASAVGLFGGVDMVNWRIGLQAPTLPAESVSLARHQ